MQTLRNERQIRAAEIRLQRKFGKRGNRPLAVVCNATFVLKHVELAETCMADGCTAKAVKRIGFNCWGAVCEYDVCEKHMNRDGVRGDSL